MYLKGDMSLVGTRPPTVDEFEQYEGYHKRQIKYDSWINWSMAGKWT